MFFPLASSSKGNAFYIGDRSEGILIDVGLGPRVLKNAMALAGLEPSMVKAVFVTHEHSDHVKGLRQFTQAYDVPVYGSRETLEELIMHNHVAEHTQLFEINKRTVEQANVAVSAFDTSHDSVHSLGFRVETPGGKAIGFSTDLGVVTAEVAAGLHGCKLVMIESNYDREMLRTGPYPMFLKRRVASRTGHLSNDDCAAEMVRLVLSGTEQFVLGHLSEENNRPGLALEHAIDVLQQHDVRYGKDCDVWVAPRSTVGKWVEL